MARNKAKPSRRHRRREATGTGPVYQARLEPKRSHEQPRTVTGLPTPPLGVLEGRPGAVGVWMERHLDLDFGADCEATASPDGVLTVTPRWGMVRTITIEPMETTS